MALVFRVSSCLCFLIKNAPTPLVFGAEGLTTLNFSPSLCCVNYCGVFLTSVLSKGGVGRKRCCFWCSSTIGEGKGWTKSDEESETIFFKWQRRVTFLVSGIIVFFVNLGPDAAIYSLLFFPVALAKNFKVIPYWLSFALYFTASRHSLNQISNKERRLRVCLFAETAGNLFDFPRSHRGRRGFCSPQT